MDPAYRVVRSETNPDDWYIVCTSKADISFQDTAQGIVDTVEKGIKPLMKRMSGQHYSKILDELDKIRKLADTIRREAGNLGID